MVDTIKANVLTMVLKKVHHSELGVAKAIVRKRGDNPGQRENEDHLYTKEVKEITRRLMAPECEGGAAITCDDISNFSVGVYLCDGPASMSIRPQDKSALLAKDLHFQLERGNEHLLDIMSFRNKNHRTLMKADGGKMNLRRKHSVLVDAYVFMTVFGRAILRMNGITLDDEANPLDNKGQLLSKHYVDALFIRAGEGYLGLPSVRVNIFRSIQISMAVIEIRDRVGGDSETDPELKRIAREMCTPMDQVLKAYFEVQPHRPEIRHR